MIARDGVGRWQSLMSYAELGSAHATPRRVLLRRAHGVVAADRRCGGGHHIPPPPSV